MVIGGRGIYEAMRQVEGPKKLVEASITLVVRQAALI